MDTQKYICPFKKTIINENNQLASYLRWERKKRGMDTKSLRYLIYLETFKEIATKEIFHYAYSTLLYSLPDFKEKYGIPYKITKFLIDYFGIIPRTHSEACVLAAKKSKKTNLIRYGVDQTFKVKEFNEKRKKTYILKYGVDNPFKIKNFLEKMESVFLKNFGCSIREKRSIDSKIAWSSKTIEEKEEWLLKTIRSEQSLKNNTQLYESSLEKDIQEILVDNQVPFSSQFKMGRYVFDIYLSNSKVLVEINGTIWHADPELYKENDIMPVSRKTAKEIWEKDKNKIDLAREKGFSVVTIWERELHLLNREDKFLLLYEKIKSIYENKIN
jgi:very-short-patch-repair endonuclease